MTGRTFLFGTSTIAAAIGGQGEYAHTFGGPPDREGASPADCGGILIHLLHRLDLTDPAVPVRVPGVRWLPLYYCFDFRVNDLGYRLVSDDRLVTYFPANECNVSDHESWPADDYPAAFPASPITVAAHPYDPTDREDAYAWAGVFGIDRLSKRDRAVLKRRAAKEADLFGYPPPETDDELQPFLTLPFLQGRPTDACLNPDCPNHTAPGRLRTFALMPAEPVPGVQTFGPLGSEVRLIFQICDRCSTIRASNECG